jgi:hypothetical protein
MKSKTQPVAETSSDTANKAAVKPKMSVTKQKVEKPVMKPKLNKPVMKAKKKTDSLEEGKEVAKPRPVMKPKMIRPVMKPTNKE